MVAHLLFCGGSCYLSTDAGETWMKYATAEDARDAIRALCADAEIVEAEVQPKRITLAQPIKRPSIVALIEQLAIEKEPRGKARRLRWYKAGRSNWARSAG
jgi:hypothetical protein